MSLLGELRFAARAVGLKPLEFIRQGYDFLRTPEGCDIHEELAIWRKRHQIASEHLKDCEEKVAKLKVEVNLQSSLDGF